jgi:hypothetical protein
MKNAWTILLAAGAVTGIVALAPHPSRAAEAPWCAVFTSDPGGAVEDCRFSSFERCRSAVISGNRGVCAQNPRWLGWWQPRR